MSDAEILEVLQAEIERLSRMIEKIEELQKTVAFLQDQIDYPNWRDRR